MPTPHVYLLFPLKTQSVPIGLDLLQNGHLLLLLAQVVLLAARAGIGSHERQRGSNLLRTQPKSVRSERPVQ